MRPALLLLLALPVLLASCATASGLIDSKTDGVGKVYSIPPSKAWDAARAVLAWEEAYDLEEHKDEACITADLPSTFTSYGGVIGVWVEPSGKSSSRVTVLTKRKLATTMGTPLTENEFHDRFAKAVSIIKSGKPLPTKAP